MLGLSVYIYVPIAASKNPPINWDNAVNLKNFLHLVLRKDYGGVTKSAEVPIQIRMINASNYLKTIVSVFSYQVLLLGFLGMFKLFKKNKIYLLALLTAFLSTGIISVIYVVNPVATASAWGIFERYYVLSTLVFMFFVPYGLILLKDFLNTKFSKPIFAYLLLSYFLIVPILMIKYNHPRTNLSSTTIGNSLARNILKNLPKNSVLFVSGDNTTFSVWYVYYVLQERPDISIINPPGVGNNIFLDKELNEFYANNPKTSLKEVISKTFVAIKDKRRIFTTYQIDPMPKDTILIPQGLVFEMIKANDLPNKLDYLTKVEKDWKNIVIKRREMLTLAEQNFIAPEIPFIYSMGLTRNGDFLISNYQDPAKAEHYYRRALWIDDTNPQAYSGLALSLFSAYKDCNGSLQNIKQAIDIYPVWKKYYVQQYYFAKNCKVEKEKLESLKKEYKNLFRMDIDKDII